MASLEKQDITQTQLENAATSTSLERNMQGDKLHYNAKDGAAIEHDLTPLQALKAYPSAVFWALMMSMCVVMEGYDTILIGNFYAFPTFQRKYGTYFPELDGYQLTAPWQVALSNSAGIGAFFGALLNGYLVTRFGYKKVILGCLAFLSCTITMTFMAPNIETLMAGEILCGLPWGAIATLAPSYASEVLPLPLRVYLTSYTNMCFIMGQLIAAGVLAGLVNMQSEWGYRIPFALQWVWPAFLLPILYFAPESPWYLARSGRLEEAELSLKRLVRSSSGIDTKASLAMIIHTDNLEQEMSVGTSYLDCFKGPERRRTEIACVSFAGQVLSGSTFAYNSTYFFSQVGLNTDTTYKLNTGGTGMALFATLISWFFLMPYFGRRTIYVLGMGTMSAILFVIGILNTKRESSSSIGMTQAVLTLVWTFTFQLSAGQLGWALPAEVGSTRLRQKTIVLARNAYYIVSVISNIVQPYFMNPTELNLKGYTGFVWGATAFLTLVWAFFRLPETKGRSFEDLDILFAKKVPTRQFKRYDVNAYDEVETAKVTAGVSNV